MSILTGFICLGGIDARLRFKQKEGLQIGSQAREVASKQDLIAQHMIDSQPQIWKSIFPPLEEKASKLQLHIIHVPGKINHL
jgi:hypothetical protein